MTNMKGHITKFYIKPGIKSEPFVIVPEAAAVVLKKVAKDAFTMRKLNSQSVMKLQWLPQSGSAENVGATFNLKLLEPVADLLETETIIGLGDESLPSKTIVNKNLLYLLTMLKTDKQNIALEIIENTKFQREMKEASYEKLDIVDRMIDLVSLSIWKEKRRKNDAKAEDVWDKLTDINQDLSDTETMAKIRALTDLNEQLQHLNSTRNQTSLLISIVTIGTRLVDTLIGFQFALWTNTTDTSEYLKKIQSDREEFSAQVNELPLYKLSNNVPQNNVSLVCSKIMNTNCVFSLRNDQMPYLDPSNIYKINAEPFLDYSATAPPSKVLTLFDLLVQNLKRVVGFKDSKIRLQAWIHLIQMREQEDFTSSLKNAVKDEAFIEYLFDLESLSNWQDVTGLGTTFSNFENAKMALSPSLVKASVQNNGGLDSFYGSVLGAKSHSRKRRSAILSHDVYFKSKGISIRTVNNYDKLLKVLISADAAISFKLSSTVYSLSFDTRVGNGYVHLKSPSGQTLLSSSSFSGIEQTVIGAEKFIGTLGNPNPAGIEAAQKQQVPSNGKSNPKQSKIQYYEHKSKGYSYLEFDPAPVKTISSSQLRLQSAARGATAVSYGLMIINFLRCAQNQDWKCMGITAGMVGGSHGSQYLAKYLLNRFQPKLLPTKEILSGVLGVIDKSTGSLKGAVAPTHQLSKVYRITNIAAKSLGPVLGVVSFGMSMYYLVDSIKDLQAGNIHAIAGIVQSSVSAITATVAIVFGIFAALNMFAKASVILTIVSVIIDVLMLIGMQIYSAVVTVNEIDKVVPLTEREKFDTGARAFFGDKPMDYIQTLKGLKEWNDASASSTFRFLKGQDTYDRYIQPSYAEIKLNPRTPFSWKQVIAGIGGLAAGAGPVGAAALVATEVALTPLEYDRHYQIHNDSYVDLNYNGYVYRHRASPKESYGVFCKLSAEEYITNITDESPVHLGNYCENAFGIGIKTSRKHKRTLFTLGNGTDTGIAAVDDITTFMCERGDKTYIGGDQDDVFLINDTSITGRLDGKGGYNSLILKEDFDRNYTVEIDLKGNSLFQTKTDSRVVIQNMKDIVGRQSQQEIITVACSTRSVMSNAGTPTAWDRIKIPNSKCNNSTVFLNVTNFTSVVNSAKSGTFTYLLELTKDLSLKIEHGPSHSIVFDFSYARIMSIIFDKDEHTLEIIGEHGFNLHVPMIPDESTACNTVPKNQPRIFTTFNFSSNLFEAEIRVYNNEPMLFHSLDQRHSEYNGKRMGYNDFSNVFILLGGRWRVQGSIHHTNDMFLIQNGFEGSIDGMSHGNTLMMSKELYPNQIISLNTREQTIRFVYNSKATSVSFRNIINIQGRENLPDKFHVDCDKVSSLSGNGGKSLLEPDYIEILNGAKCDNSNPMRIWTSNFTTVKNNAKNGTFLYTILQGGDWDVETDLLSSAVHIYQLPFVYKDIQTASFRSSDQRIFFTANILASKDACTPNTAVNDNSKRSYRVVFKDGENNGLSTAPDIRTEDDVVFKINADGVVVAWATLSDNRTFTGLDNIRHILTLTNFTGSALGGNETDIFMLNSRKPITGVIDGGKGLNTMKLMDYLDFESTISVGFGTHLMTYGKDSSTLQIFNVQIFFGRPMKENISVACDTKLIDGGGGYDVIHVPELTNCSEIPELILHVNSNPPAKIINRARTGKYVYVFRNVTSFDVEIPGMRLEVDETPTVEDTTTDENISQSTHTYQLSFALEDLTKIDFESFKLKYTAMEVEASHKILSIISDYETVPNFVTKDQARISVSQYGSVRAIKPMNSISNDTVNDIISKYHKISKSLNISLFINSPNDYLVTIGAAMEFDILTALPNLRNYLVAGDSKETLFLVQDNSSEVVIYATPSKPDQKYFLQIKNLVETARITKPKYFPEIFLQGNDLSVNVDGFQIKFVNASSYVSHWWFVFDSIPFQIQSKVSANSEEVPIKQPVKRVSSRTRECSASSGDRLSFTLDELDAVVQHSEAIYFVVDTVVITQDLPKNFDTRTFELCDGAFIYASQITGEVSVSAVELGMSPTTVIETYQSKVQQLNVPIIVDTGDNWVVLGATSYPTTFQNIPTKATYLVYGVSNQTVFRIQSTTRGVWIWGVNNPGQTCILDLEEVLRQTRISLQDSNYMPQISVTDNNIVIEVGSTQVTVVEGKISLVTWLIKGDSVGLWELHSTSNADPDELEEEDPWAEYGTSHELDNTELNHFDDSSADGADVHVESDESVTVSTTDPQTNFEGYHEDVDSVVETEASGAQNRMKRSPGNQLHLKPIRLDLSDQHTVILSTKDLEDNLEIIFHMNQINSPKNTNNPALVLGRSGDDFVVSGFHSGSYGKVLTSEEPSKLVILDFWSPSNGYKSSNLQNVKITLSKTLPPISLDKVQELQAELPSVSQVSLTLEKHLEQLITKNRTSRRRIADFNVFLNDEVAELLIHRQSGIWV